MATVSLWHPGQPISRVLSWAVIYLERRLPAASSGLPGAQTGRAAPFLPCRQASPLLGLAPGGGCLAAAVTSSAGGLLHHLFTITLCLVWQRAVCFSVALFRRVTPPGCYPAPCPAEPGLSSLLPRSQPGGSERDRLADLDANSIITCRNHLSSLALTVVRGWSAGLHRQHRSACVRAIQPHATRLDLPETRKTAAVNDFSGGCPSGGYISGARRRWGQL